MDNEVKHGVGNISHTQPLAKKLDIDLSEAKMDRGLSILDTQAGYKTRYRSPLPPHPWAISMSGEM